MSFLCPFDIQGGACRSPKCTPKCGYWLAHPTRFEMGKGGYCRAQERPEWQLLIRRVGHKGASFRSHSGGGGALKTLPRSGAMVRTWGASILMGESPAPPRPRCQSCVCLEGSGSP